MMSKLPTVCEISRPDTLVYVVAGDLNLQAKLLTLLGSIPASKTNPSNLLKLLVFFDLGCGDVQPSQIAIRSSGLSSHLVLVAGGIQLGGLRIFAMFSRAVPTFLLFGRLRSLRNFSLSEWRLQTVAERKGHSATLVLSAYFPRKAANPGF
jgi:hypothetical protein